MKPVACLAAGLVLSAMAVSWAEDAGDALYRNGEGAQAIVAGGTIRMDARAFACAGCHGVDGQGSREGSTVIPPLVWSRLSRATPTRPAYDAASFARALAEGVDPAGRNLSRTMPRYEVGEDTLAALVAFLARLETQQHAGIQSRELLLRPPDEAMTKVGFEAALAETNRLGGVHGRMLATAGSGAAALDMSALDGDLARRLVRAEHRALLAALVKDGYSAFELVPADIEDDFHALLAEHDLNLKHGAPAVLLAAPPPEEAIGSLAGRTIYLRRDSLTRSVVGLAGSHRRTMLVMTAPFPEAADWARRTGHGRSAAWGYALGQMASDAALAAGRSLTVAKLAAALAVPGHEDIELRRFAAGN